MLKKIIFILSDYYYEVLCAHLDTINEKVLSHSVSIQLLTSKAPFTNSQDTLFITDEKETLDHLLEKGCYAIALYHEKNHDQIFSGARYAVEDVFQLEYCSYDEAYRRLAGIPWNVLETDRLQVRETILEDVPEFYRIYESPAITYYMEPLCQDPEEEKAYIDAYIRQVYGFYGFGLWTVLSKKTGRIIGRAGLNIREGYDLPELGFMIDTAYQRQGLGFEVCKAILSYAKEALYFDQIQAFVKEENTASRSLLKKLGFSYQREAFENGQDYLLYHISL